LSLSHLTARLQGGLFGFSTDYPPALDDAKEGEEEDDGSFFGKLLDALDVTVRAPVETQTKWEGQFSRDSPEGYNPGDELNAEISYATNKWIKTHEEESRITDGSFFSVSRTNSGSSAASPSSQNPDSPVLAASSPPQEGGETTPGEGEQESYTTLTESPAAEVPAEEVPALAEEPGPGVQPRAQPPTAAELGALVT